MSRVATHQKTQQGLKQSDNVNVKTVLEVVATHQKTQQGLKRTTVPGTAHFFFLVATHQKTQQGLKQFLRNRRHNIVMSRNASENPAGIET